MSINQLEIINQLRIITKIFDGRLLPDINLSHLLFYLTVKVKINLFHFNYYIRSLDVNLITLFTIQI